MIAQLEIECGIVDPVPGPVQSLIQSTYLRMVSRTATVAEVSQLGTNVQFLMSMDPERPVLEHMWDGEG